MFIQSEVLIKEPLVSIVICTYNQEQYIRQCIDSILNQNTEYPFEIIIGEDCGTDRTRDICIEYQKKYPEKIKLLLYEKNGGLVKNWFNCIKEAKGRFIMTCAGDDFWHNPDKITIQIDYMLESPEYGISHTDYHELNVKTNEIIYNSFSKRNIKIYEGKIQKEIFNGTAKFCAPTICFRKELIDKHIDLDSVFKLDFPIEDWPTLVILSKYTLIKYLNFSSVTYRTGQESVSNPGTYEKIINRFYREKIMYKYVCSLFPVDLIYNEEVYDRYVNNVLLGLALKQGDVKKGNEFATNMLKLGDKSMRTRFSSNWFGFWIWWLIKKLRR